MKKWIFNPFVYIAGTKALLIGWSVMLATAWIGFYSHTHFDGVIDVHTGRVSPISIHFLEQLVAWGVPVIIFYVAGMIFSHSRIRLIDVAGTIALSRVVMIFPAVIGFGIHAPAAKPKTLEDVMKMITPQTIGLGLLVMAFTIWMVALLYNAYSVSCNMKGGKATGVFIGGLVLSEIVAFIIIHQFL